MYTCTCMYNYIHCTCTIIIHVYNYILSLCRPKYSSLFYLELVIDQDGVHYTSSFESFESVMALIFDRGLLSTHSVPQLERVHTHIHVHVYVHVHVLIHTCTCT